MTVDEETLDRYEALLDRTDVEMQNLYVMLTDMSERLDPTTSWAPVSDDLGLRMALGQVQQYVLAARHEIHGGITQIIMARAESTRRRPLP